MKTQVTSKPREQDNDTIYNGLKEYCEQYVASDMELLSVFLRDEQEEIIAGLTGKTYWKVLHVDFAWVNPTIRGKSLGTKIFDLAEEEAKKRGCTGVVLDTMSFQAQPFYEKRGYRFIGAAGGYPDGITRNYMEKAL